MERARRSLSTMRLTTCRPLTVLQGNLEVALLKARTQEEYREALINNLEQVGRLISLTRSLLTLAKFTGDPPHVRPAPLALQPLIHDLLAELSILFDEHRITYRLKHNRCPTSREMRMDQAGVD